MSEPEVDRAVVEHVANLARIDLTDAEIERFQAEFAEIVDYFDRLEEIQAIDDRPADRAVTRADTVTESLSQAEALANAADTEDGYFKGPPVS